MFQKMLQVGGGGFIKKYLFKENEGAQVEFGDYKGDNRATVTITNSDIKLGWLAPVKYRFYTSQKINLDEYSLLIVEHTFTDTGSSSRTLKIGVSDSNSDYVYDGVPYITSVTNSERHLAAIDVSEIIGEKYFKITNERTSAYQDNITIYNIWLL